MSSAYPNFALAIVALFVLTACGCTRDPLHEPTESILTPEDHPRFESWFDAVANAEQQEAGGHFSSTERALLSALDIATEIANDGFAEPLVDTHYYLGRHYFAMHMPEESEFHFQRMFSAADGHGILDDHQIAEGSLRLGWAQNDLGKFDEAIASLSIAADFFEAIGEGSDFACASLGALAAAQISSNQDRDAYDSLQRLASQHLEKDSPNNVALAFTLREMSGAAMRLGNLEDAEAPLAAAVELAEQGVLQDSLCDSIFRLGIDLSKQNGDQESLAYFQSKFAFQTQSIPPMDQSFDPPNASSIHKQTAYEDMTLAKEEYERVKRRYDVEHYRFREMRNYSDHNVGEFGAMGVSAMNFLPEAPDKYVFYELQDAKQAYLEAKRKYDSLGG